jgi:sulfite reductase alpha subunit
MASEELPITPSLWPEPPPKEKVEEYLAELEKGPWPSHVTELKKTKYPVYIYGMGLVAGATPWATSAAKAPGIYSGVLSRMSHPWTRITPPVFEDHARVLIPSAQVFTTTLLRFLIEASRRYGWGLLQFIGGTGDVVINVVRERLIDLDIFLRRIGLDIGGSGDVMRNTVSCPGPLLCPYAIYDTLKARDFTYGCLIDWATYPQFPYKIKFKYSGCPIDCLKAQARADYVIIGTWRGAPDVDDEKLRQWIEEGGDVEELVRSCPTRAITWDGSRLSIDGSKCVKCMECIRRAYPAIKPGKERGLTVLIGGTIKSRSGPKLAKVLIPFIPLPSPDKLEEALMTVFQVIRDRIVPKWDEEGWRRERVGDTLIRVTWQRFLRDFAKFDPDLAAKITKATPTEPYYSYGITFFNMSEEQKQKYLEDLRKAMETWQ